MPPNHFPPPLPADDHERPLRGEGAPQVRHGAVPSDVEDDVVAVAGVGEVLPGVIDDVVGAERPHQLGFRGAADAGHLRVVGLCELHGERPHATAGADDQDALPSSNLALVAQSLEGGRARRGNGRCLREAEARRLAREPVRSRACVLSEGAAASPEHLFPRLEAGHLLANRLDSPRHVVTGNGVLGRAHTDARDPEQIRQSRHLVPDALIDPGRLCPNKHMVIPNHRPVDLPEFQDVRRAVPVLDDCLHRDRSSMHSIISCCFDLLSTETVVRVRAPTKSGHLIAVAKPDDPLSARRCSTPSRSCFRRGTQSPAGAFARPDGAFMESGRKRRRSGANQSGTKTAQTSRIRCLQLPVVARTTMVRRGSTVRVRQRALSNRRTARKQAVFCCLFRNRRAPPSP
jgi:hypothetical protein